MRLTKISPVSFMSYWMGGRTKVRIVPRSYSQGVEVCYDRVCGSEGERSAKYVSSLEIYYCSDLVLSAVQQNRLTESKIQRRLSRIVLKKKKSTELLKNTGPATGGLVAPDQSVTGMSSSAGPGSMLGSSLGLFPSTFGPSSVQGPAQFLRIRIADTADAGHVSTTIHA